MRGDWKFVRQGLEDPEGSPTNTRFCGCEALNQRFTQLNAVESTAEPGIPSEFAPIPRVDHLHDDLPKPPLIVVADRHAPKSTNDSGLDVSGAEAPGVRFEKSDGFVDGLRRPFRYLA